MTRTEPSSMGKSGQPGSIPKRSRLRDRDSNQTRQTAFLLSPSPDKGERPVEEAPGGPAQAHEKQDRMTPFHRASLRRGSAAACGPFRAFPQGSSWTGATPQKGGVGVATLPVTPPPLLSRTSGNNRGVASVLPRTSGAARSGRVVASKHLWYNNMALWMGVTPHLQFMSHTPP